MAHDRELAFLISANVIDFPESCEIAQPRRVAANLPSISAALLTAAGLLHTGPSCPRTAASGSTHEGAAPKHM